MKSSSYLTAFDFFWKESGEFVFNFGRVMHWALCPAWFVFSSGAREVVEFECPVVVAPYDIESEVGHGETEFIWFVGCNAPI